MEPPDRPEPPPFLTLKERLSALHRDDTNTNGDTGPSDFELPKPKPDRPRFLSMKQRKKILLANLQGRSSKTIKVALAPCASIDLGPGPALTVPRKTFNPLSLLPMNRALHIAAQNAVVKTVVPRVTAPRILAKNRKTTVKKVTVTKAEPSAPAMPKKLYVSRRKQQQRVEEPPVPDSFIYAREIAVLKSKLAESENARRAAEEHIEKQAEEYRRKHDESMDNVRWKERYAHLENFCRVCKGENINLKIQVNTLKKDLERKDKEAEKKDRDAEKKDKEIQELHLDLAYVRSLCTLPIPPRVKKPRKPRKPRAPKLAPMPQLRPMSPSMINL